MATPADPELVCGASIPSDPHAADRAACSFPAGVRSSQTLGIQPGVQSTLPVRHLIVLMKENRSFDHLLGHLRERGQPDVEAIPAGYANADSRGAMTFPFPATTTCLASDPGHQVASVAVCMDQGRMDGFVLNAAATTATDGRFVMANYDAPDLPFYYWLARTFAVSDRHFASIAGGTYSNRDFLLFGTNAGVLDTGTQFPAPSTPSLMQLLMNAGYTWGVYSDGNPLSGSLDWRAGDPGVHSMQEFLDALDSGTLPSVAFVDGGFGEDDHPASDLQVGEAWVRNVYQHAVASPQWLRLAIIWTYDEGGGFADHVPPVPAPCPLAGSESSSLPMGPRVPLVAISPWARRNFASHVVHDHTAIARLVEVLFDLPALTARDANSDALLDLFDFSCGRDLTVLAAPPAGAAGCR